MSALSSRRVTARLPALPRMLRRLLLPALLPASMPLPAAATPPEHDTFAASLHAPFREAAPIRRFRLDFTAPAAQPPARRSIRWQLTLLSPAGKVARRWSGNLALAGQAAGVTVRWPERRPPAGAGVYQLRLQASLREPGSGDAGVDDGGDNTVEQRADIAVGRYAAPAVPSAAALATRGGARDGAGDGAPGRAAYAVYYGNLHSHSNHSDGGGALPGCHGAQPPQQGRFGPADAYAFASRHGLDFLVTSEHNHMYDGSDGLNADADPDAAKALFRSGLAAAAGFTAAHPGFLAVYGDEWGVIKGGGHLNIFNGDLLAGWEFNNRQQLLADTFVAKGDYPALYTLMRTRGWLGQFNHPAATGQFRAGGADLGYTSDGDAAVALCEVLNSSAFSVKTDESETGLNNYETACDKALEAGYHLAFSSDQDNHCANWGASYGNRTALLLPAGTALTPDSFIAAIAARRVFATMDKDASLLLTANGHIMGERFDNSGPLLLEVAYTHTGARGGAVPRVAAVRLLEGVPGRNGQVTLLANAAALRLHPSPGPHFYYARLTQDDGKVLWSAPVWVNQAAERNNLSHAGVRH